jgi:hypothetical protein
MTQKIVVTPWCDAKHYDYHGSTTYCTCAETPGHTGAHRCFGCTRTWPNTQGE